MRLLPSSIEAAIAEFAKLPGIGPRTAERLVFFLLRGQSQQGDRLGQAIIDMRQNVRNCSICFNLAERDVCDICNSSDRQTDLLAVVEEPLDVIALEKTGIFRGRYHVLGGSLSPIDGIGPAQLQIPSLLARIEKEAISELILATNPSTEGETTALYIRRQLEHSPIKVTRLARGLPVGGDLEYADQITLGRAIEGRNAF